MRVAAMVLSAGACRARVMRLDQPLSFWGGFDPVTGRIVDRHHPQAGAAVTGRALVMPGSRGSAGTPAGLAEALRRGLGPAAVLLAVPDVNIAIGAMTAGRLYGLGTPVLAGEFDGVADGVEVVIGEDGVVAW